MNKKCKKSIQDMIIDEIDEMIEIASQCGGQVFGGYVRDVIVPRLYDKQARVEFSNVDLWFMDTMLLDDFLKKCHSIEFLESVESGELFYFNKYQLLSDKIPIAKINIYTSSYLPVDDFNIHMLSYMILNGKYEPLSHNNQTEEFLISKILDKDIEVTDHSAQKNFSRVKKFLKLGYSITYRGNVITNLHTEEDLLDIYFKSILSEYNCTYSDVYSRYTCILKNDDLLNDFYDDQYLTFIRYENENHIFLYDDGIINFEIMVIVHNNKKHKIINGELMSLLIKDLREILDYIDVYCRST